MEIKAVQQPFVVIAEFTLPAPSAMPPSKATTDRGTPTLPCRGSSPRACGPRAAEGSGAKFEAGVPKPLFDARFPVGNSIM